MEQGQQESIDRLVKAIDKAYVSTGSLMWRSFFGGIMSGLGATVGVAIVLSLIGYVFSRLGGIELLRPGIERLQDMIILKNIR